MGVASRTPEGDPFACRVCGAAGLLEPSPLVGDAVCPRCGSRLAELLMRFGDLFGRSEEPVRPGMPLAELTQGDPFELADLVADLGAVFGVTADPTNAAECHTVEDLIAHLTDLRDRRRE